MSTDSATWTTEQRRLVDWLADMNEDDALPLAKRMLLEDGADPIHVLDLCRAAMDIVGKRFEEGEYFLPELVLAGEMLDTIGAIAKPLIKQAGGGALAVAGVAMLRGAYDEALRVCAEGVRVMGDTSGPAVFIYRGEVLRRMGRLEEARADLELAVRRSPRCLSATINLALISDEAKYAEVVFDRAPALMSDARRAAL